jgi:uncharacterized protein (DUF4415 family)
VKSTERVSATRLEESRRKALAEETQDAEIEAAIVSDPDWAEIEPIDWSKAEVVTPPKKLAISIRLDEDLILFFKAEGPGYQRRINAVLRTYVKERLGRA